MSQRILDGVSDDSKRQAKHLCFQNSNSDPSLSGDTLNIYSSDFTGKLNLSNFPNIRKITFYYNVVVTSLESIDISENMELNKIFLCYGNAQQSPFFNASCIFIIKERQLNQVVVNYYKYSYNGYWMERCGPLKHQGVMPYILVENGKRMEELEAEAERLNEQVKNLMEENEKTPTPGQFQELVDIVFSPNADLDFNDLKNEIKELKLKDCLPYYKKEKENISKLISNAKENAGKNLEKFLDLLLLIQKQSIERNQENDSYAQGQINAYKIILQEKLDSDELETLLNEQRKILKLESQLHFLKSKE